MAEIVDEVKSLGLETCATLGMLTRSQAERLKDAGLDYYNHNLDTSEAYYDRIISTRTYQDRLDTLAHVREAGIHVCCGGILGMGESPEDRAELLRTLANLPEHPESVPINMLVRVEGTPLEGEASIDPFDFVRTIAVARILMPESFVRLSAGREAMSSELQALASSPAPIRSSTARSCSRLPTRQRTRIGGSSIDSACGPWSRSRHGNAPDGRTC